MKLALTAATLLATAGCSSMGMASADTPARSASATATPTTAAGYIKMAAASDLYETQSSQLALGRTRDAGVRDYAQMMITDHAKTTATLEAQASAAGLNPPVPMMTPMQQDMVARLRPLSGAAFDREYLRQQTVSHQMALDLHQGYADGGDRPALRTAASAAVPVVAEHLRMVQGMSAAM